MNFYKARSDHFKWSNEYAEMAEVLCLLQSRSYNSQEFEGMESWIIRGNIPKKSLLQSPSTWMPAADLKSLYV